MNVNKNLHSKTLLTEFARNFEEESNETVISKLVNKLYEACNNVNNDSSSSSNSQEQQQHKNNDEIQNESSSTSMQSSSSSSSATATTSQNSPEKNKESSVLVYQVDTSQGRTSLNVIKRISNLIAMKDKDLNDYKNTDLQKLWMPDDKSRECYDCSQKFTTFRRKHHCRLCGQIFCSRCCRTIIPGKIINCNGDLRVCTYCSKVVLSYIKSPDINRELKSDLQALEEDLSNKFVGVSNNANSNNTAESSPHRKISVGYQEERLITNSNVLSNADRKTILQQSNTLKSLYEDMLCGLQYHNKGVDLVNFLITTQKSSNKAQAVTVLNAMIEAGFIVPMIQYENIEPHNTVNIEFNENLYYKVLKLDDIETINETEKNENIPTETTADDIMRDDLLLPNINVDNLYSNEKENELQNSFISTVGSKPLLEAYCEHEELLLNQMLRNENLDTTWAKVLIPQCARIAHNIHPECSSRFFESMDVRNFVNIKKISGGTRNECMIIGGVVFSKNVAHKDMKTKIDNPKVLLLQCPIAYQRVEGKFVTIESLILQEKEYLRNVTSRILSLSPDIVLVHKNVAGIAQDLLRDNGITLVLDVKLSVFERLARCMQCDIVTSIDSNIGRPKLGTCKRFYTKNYIDGNGFVKSLMFFDILYSQRGCSLLLRGGSEDELARLKKVSSFLLFARYNWRLELSYLLDSFAQPPLPKSSIFDSIDQSQMSPVDNKTKVDTIVTANFDLSKTENSKKEKTVNIENVSDFSDPLRASTFEMNTIENVEFEVQDSFDNKFRTSLASTILSISPFINFPLPYFETEAGKRCELRKFFPKELFFSKQWIEKNNEKIEFSTVLSTQTIEKNEDSRQTINPTHDFLTMKITVPADDKNFQTALADYRRKGSTYQKVMRMKTIEKKQEGAKILSRQKSISESSKDAFNILNHQRLPVLFCSFYLNNNSKEVPTSFCAQPLILDMHFYGQDDIMLGLFLERYCFKNSYICQSCKLPMMDHVRRYAHSMGVVQVKLDNDPNKNETNSANILMTSRCTICNTMSKSVTMSPDTWCLSFAKFLELKFHGNFYTRRNIEQDDAESSQFSQQSVCRHSLYHDHIQYFSNNGIIVSFMYTPVEIWEIKLPLLSLPLKSPETINKKTFTEKIKSFSVRGYDVYAKIHEKLANLSTEDGSPILTNLKKVLNRDQLIFKHRVEVVHTLLASSDINQYEIHDAMYMVYKELADSIELWGPRLNEVAIHLKNAQKQGEITSQTSVEVFDELEDNNTQSTDDLELDLDGGLMMRSTDELQNEKKDKIDKKTIRKLLSTILPSSSDQNPLPTPFTPNEHYCISIGQFPVLVHDQDLSSIIAYCLMSYEYKKMLENLTFSTSNDNSNSPNLKRKNTNDGLVENEEKDKENKDSNEKNNKKHSNSHIEYHFQDSYTQFTCKCYFAKEFDELRNKCLTTNKKQQQLNEEMTQSALYDDIRKNYARSLSESLRWDAKGGKSGSKFSKTKDDRFILKEMSKQDVGEFEKFAPNYFEYVNDCVLKNHPTLLAKIFGIYKVIIKKKESVTEKAVLVIENLFCNRRVTNKYDLKGSERNRLVDTAGQTGDTVLLDENLIKTSWSRPLYILTHSRIVLRNAILRDSSFLEKNHVMDYSLLVGLDDDNFLIVGIIDYIRKYTIDKRVESFLKQVVDQSKLPTIVSPNVYKNRFIDAMDRYFLCIPERFDSKFMSVMK
ncbi:hypothetical protein PVAND_005452 [Polypedilum vanderplanki]|uniref:1-phosphatidylinositol-3-phosphate 5-kinase n=1 Tax=Polypedilum vanderplanki TaxID=319348 RepID=A0A9J6C130_POLVA|nr:hypothetical protein PVAND_005452 [Polypedilum vanderplanki]